MSSYAHVVHTSAKQVISRRRKNENVFKMSKVEKCTCKACKNTVFHCQICKFVRFLLPSSSWLLKFPIFSQRKRHKVAPNKCPHRHLFSTIATNIRRITPSGSETFQSRLPGLPRESISYLHALLCLPLCNRHKNCKMEMQSSTRQWAPDASRKPL